MTMWRSMVAVVLAAALGAAVPAQAQDASWKRCTEAGVEIRIASCTSLIDSGRLSPRELPNAHYLRAAAYMGKGQFDEAIKDYNVVIRLAPGEAAGWNGHCFARAIVDQLDAALKDCNEALRLQPADAEMLDSRGFVHLKTNRLDAAIADFNAALKLDARKAHALFGRGVAYRRKGDAATGAADVAAARAIQADIGRQYAKHGVR